MRISDWSSDVCSSDLEHFGALLRLRQAVGRDLGLQAFGQDAAGVGVLDTREQLPQQAEARRDHARRVTRMHAFLQHRDGEVAAGQRSEENTSELQSLMRISYAVFCLKKKKKTKSNK